MEWGFLIVSHSHVTLPHDWYLLCKQQTNKKNLNELVQPVAMQNMCVGKSFVYVANAFQGMPECFLNILSTGEHQGVLLFLSCLLVTLYFEGQWFLA